ncbi:hypothetical protein B0H19DRAFT_898351, partial [Mycena capillaripes]
ITDYSLQEKYRPVNVVHLNHLKDHCLYYVALSRGKTTAETVIIKGIDTSKIQTTMSGIQRTKF